MTAAADIAFIAPATGFARALTIRVLDGPVSAPDVSTLNLLADRRDDSGLSSLFITYDPEDCD